MSTCLSENDNSCLLGYPLSKAVATVRAEKGEESIAKTVLAPSPAQMRLSKPTLQPTSSTTLPSISALWAEEALCNPGLFQSLGEVAAKRFGFSWPKDPSTASRLLKPYQKERKWAPFFVAKRAICEFFFETSMIKDVSQKKLRFRPFLLCAGGRRSSLMAGRGRWFVCNHGNAHYRSTHVQIPQLVDSLPNEPHIAYLRHFLQASGCRLRIQQI